MEYTRVGGLQTQLHHHAHETFFPLWFEINIPANFIVLMAHNYQKYLKKEHMPFKMQTPVDMG